MTQQFVSYQVNPELFLHRISSQAANTTAVVTKRIPVNHIMVLDCSGSMANDLLAIRQQLKNKLPTLVQEGDTITIIWFSAKGQFGVLKEEVEVRSLTDLSDLNNAIDRFLRPIGLTGFKEPLEETLRVIQRITKNRKDTAFSLFFLTDGHDNQWSDPQNLAAVKALQPVLSSAVFVEYGWYCNKTLLIKMAEACGGSLIFSDGFSSYAPVLESALGKGITSTKKIEVKFPIQPLYDFAYTIDEDGTINQFNVEENNTISVNEGVEDVWFLGEDKTETPYSVDEIFDHYQTEYFSPFHKAVYAALQILAGKGKSTEVYAILKQTGDVKFINKYTNCFGKQALAEFQQMCNDIVLELVEPLEKGRNTELVPREDAFCVLDLFTLLQTEEENQWQPGHEAFNYNRIGSARKATGSTITDAEVKQLSEAMELIKTTKDPEQLRELMELITKINSSKVELKFTVSNPLEFYGYDTLVWNETRPNLSVTIRQNGKVTIPFNQFDIDEVNTFRFRAFTFIKDGLVNVKELPTRLGPITFAKLVEEGLINVNETYNPETVYILNLGKLPVINRNMVSTKSAQQLFKDTVKLLKLKAEQKVFGHYEKDLYPKTDSPGFTSLYGEEVSTWLKEIGITDQGGFAPKTVAEKTGETYMAKYITVGVAGLSSLPSVNAVLTKMQGGKKLTVSDSLLAKALKEYEAFTTSSIYTENEDKDALLKTWLTNKKKRATQHTRELMKSLAETKFGVVVGQSWFKEFETVDQNTLTVKVDDQDYVCKIEVGEEEITI